MTRAELIEELELERMRPCPYWNTKKPNQSEAALRRQERERQQELLEKERQR